MIGVIGLTLDDGPVFFVVHLEKAVFAILILPAEDFGQGYVLHRFEKICLDVGVGFLKLRDEVLGVQPL